MQRQQETQDRDERYTLGQLAAMGQKDPTDQLVFRSVLVNHLEEQLGHLAQAWDVSDHATARRCIREIDELAALVAGTCLARDIARVRAQIRYRCRRALAREHVTLARVNRRDPINRIARSVYAERARSHLAARVQHGRHGGCDRRSRPRARRTGSSSSTSSADPGSDGEPPGDHPALLRPAQLAEVGS